MTTRRIAWLAALLVLVLSARSADAQTVVVDLTAQNTTGTNCGGACTWSFDGVGSANNVVLSFDIGANRWVSAVAWSGVTGRLSDQAGTRGSEMAIGLGNSSTVRYQLRPFESVTATCPEPAGCGPATGAANLSALGQDFQVSPDGMLRVEFFETFDDGVDSVDAVYTAGTLTITTSDVPVELQHLEIE